MLTSPLITGFRCGGLVGQTRQCYEQRLHLGWTDDLGPLLAAAVAYVIRQGLA